MARTYTEQMQEIVERYRRAGQPWPAQARDMALWAIDNRLWSPHPSAFIDRCAEDLARAMREEYITDRQGRKVRAKHVARIKRNGQQIPLWEDIRTGSRDHMEIAFKQRREQIVGDCRQLQTDVDSFNDNHNPGAPIRLILDFTYDVEELALGEDEKSA